MLVEIATAMTLNILLMEKHGNFNRMAVFTFQERNGTKMIGHSIREFSFCKINYPLPMLQVTNLGGHRWQIFMLLTCTE